jgi:hypothetical protein
LTQVGSCRILKNRLRLLQEWFTVKNALNGDGRRQMINHRFGRSWIGGNRAGSRAKERKMSNGARHQRSRAGEGSVTGVSSTHTHTLMPLPSSPARPKLRTRTLIPHARTQHATHSDTIFLVRRTYYKFQNEWKFYFATILAVDWQ